MCKPIKSRIFIKKYRDFSATEKADIEKAAQKPTPFKSEKT